MTAARGAALGALVLAVVVVAVLLLRGDGGTTYTLRFQNAGQLVKDDDVQVGGRRIGSIRKITLTDNNQAEITVTVDERLRAAARGHDGDHPRDLAVGHRQPLHRADARPELQRPELSDGATLGTDKTTSIVDLDQLFNTLDPKTRKALQQVIQGSATRYDGEGVEANAATKYFNPALSASRRLVERARRQPADAHDLPASTRPRRPARWPSAASDLAEPRLQRQHDGGGDRGREHVAQPGARRCCRARCARPTRRSSTCARRSTTSTCSSTRPSRRRRTSRPSCASCARWCTTRARRSPT